MKKDKEEEKESLYFYKGGDNFLDKTRDHDQENPLVKVQKEILQVFDVKNLSFLLGSGCSSYYNKAGEQIGVPTMGPLAKEFYDSKLKEEQAKFLKDTLKINILDESFKDNLENFLGALFGFRFVCNIQGDVDKETATNNIIKSTKEFILSKCINDTNSGHLEVTDLYKLFYKKLIYRDKNLSKLNIFTTNYDLYSEKALDQLSILYSNGFSGNIERYFNPATFNYAYAQQMELSSGKWNVLDNFVYLYKLHGSVNWVESETKGRVFNIQEIQNPVVEKDTLMIYPTPTKQATSFGSPYSDLFREFQKKLMQDKNVLITIGYSFSDEHINNLIFQALTIPTFRLVIFQDKELLNIKKLIELNDPRIWIIGGEAENKEGGKKEKAHYFNFIINNFLPNIGNEEIEESIDKVVKGLISKSK